MEYFLFTINHKSDFDKISCFLEFMNRKLVSPKFGIMIRYKEFSGSARVCVPCREVSGAAVKVVDNGAFAVLTGKELDHGLDIGSERKLRLWLRDYLAWLANNVDHIDVWVLPDIPVHGKRFVNAPERAKRIELTARLHSEMIRMVEKELGSEALSKALPVLQGYEPEEYYRAYDLIARIPGIEGTLLGTRNGHPYAGAVGIGSVCVRKATSPSRGLAEGRARGTLDQLIARLDSMKVKKHYFGLNIRVAARNKPRIFSTDTSGHSLNFKLKWRSFLKCERPDIWCYLKAMLRQAKGIAGIEDFEGVYEEMRAYCSSN